MPTDTEDVTRAEEKRCSWKPCGKLLTGEQKKFCSIQCCNKIPRRRPANTIQSILSRAVPQENGCWEWQGAKTSAGYGNVKYQGKAQCVHVVVFEAIKGPVPEGLEIDHLCHTKACTVPQRECLHRLCCNPAHLEPVPHRVNVLRGTAGEKIARISRNKTHCPKGHPYDEANTGRTHQGHRFCLECKRSQGRGYYHKRKNAHD